MRRTPLAQLCVLAGVLLPVCSYGQPVHKGLPRLDREGWGFSCGISSEQAEWVKQNNGSADADCGQIGPLWLSASRADIEKILGRPATTKSMSGVIYFCYTLQQDKTALATTYAVVRYDESDRASVLQLTGEPWPAAWTFADIKLGDTDQAVIARLGEPHGMVPSEVPNTVEWDYLPWKFSFEITNHVVTSIRVEQ